MPLAVRAAVDDVRRHADDASVDRRVDAVPGAAPTSRPLVCGPWPPPIWYQAGPWPPPPKSLWPSRASSPSFACRPTGSSASAPSPARVEADRGHAARRDRQLRGAGRRASRSRAAAGSRGQQALRGRGRDAPTRDVAVEPSNAVRRERDQHGHDAITMSSANRRSRCSCLRCGAERRALRRGSAALVAVARRIRGTVTEEGAGSNRGPP